MSNIPNIIDEAALDALVMNARSNRLAFGKLYDQAYQPIFQYCIRRARNRSIAEDVTSTVFLSVAREINKFTGTSWQEFRRWTFKMATNELNAVFRKTLRREQLLHQATQNGDIGQTIADSPPDDSQERQQIQDSIEQLSERDQTIISLRYQSEMTYEEIGEVIGISSTAARTASKRALDKLRRKVGQS